MAHFAELDNNNIVLQVIVVENENTQDKNGNEVEAIGAEFCHNLLGGRWIQTSYNSKIRNTFAAIGYEYLPDKDIFRSPKPFNSWIWSDEKLKWEAPIPYPDDTLMYQWDENIRDWEAITFEVTD